MRDLPAEASDRMVFDSRLGEKLADQTLFFFVFDTGKQFLAEPVDCLGFVEGEFVINLAALKMAGLTSRLEDWLNLAGKVRLLCGGGKGESREVLCADARTPGLCVPVRSYTQS